VVERYRLIDYEEAKGALERNEKENARGVYSDFDPNYRGSCCSCILRSRMKASSLCRGRQPSRIGAPWANGRTLSARKTGMNPQPERRARSRPRTSRISERAEVPHCARNDTSDAKHAFAQVSVSTQVLASHLDANRGGGASRAPFAHIPELAHIPLTFTGTSRELQQESNNCSNIVKALLLLAC
jgi:hypothetical protein